LIDKLRKTLSVVRAVSAGWLNGFAGDPITFIDFGARGGLSRAWQVLYKAGLVRPIFFEPEASAAWALSQAYPGAYIERKAAWDSAGPTSLYVTDDLGCSSLLRPVKNAQLLSEATRQYSVREVANVDTIRADQCASIRALAKREDLIVKADVQGGELAILRGFGQLLDCIRCCELEVSFTQTYLDHPTAERLFEFMFDAGFGLFHLQTFGVRSTRHAIQANAYFCRRDTTSAGRRQKDVERIFLLASGITPAY
jgi:FkbM family methyltransferase